MNEHLSRERRFSCSILEQLDSSSVSTTSAKYFNSQNFFYSVLCIACNIRLPSSSTCRSYIAQSPSNEQQWQRQEHGQQGGDDQRARAALL
mmetsp:Transcript_8099/g.13647  ORF Transcript_8099/g.13647 Transcript_8099/m.13647 type:complete len:91 (-) Transcript_8099:433-705(-)